MNDIFPLSERSGVNLRGEYGPMWEGPPDLQEGKQLILEVANKEEQKGGTKDESGDINMGEDIDPELSPEQKKTCRCIIMPIALDSDRHRQCCTRPSGSYSTPFLSQQYSRRWICLRHFSTP